MFKLIKLGLSRFHSPEDYHAMQHYIAENTVAELEARGIDFGSLHMLELGAGHGGYSRVLHQKSRAFIASDLYEIASFVTWNIPFTMMDVSKPFPFKHNLFDLIYCSSLVEHISQPGLMLKECWKVLKPGGILFLSFPPFYSLALIGGHQFKPFHFLGENLAIKIYNLYRKTNIQSYATSFGSWGLHPLTIAQVKRLILVAGFEVIETYTRLSPINSTQLPGILKDLATWHVCYLAKKPD